MKCKSPWNWECVWVWNTLSQMGESATDGTQWLPSALILWELHSCRSYECSKPWLERQTSTKLGPQDTIKKFLKHRCLKWPHLFIYVWFAWIMIKRKGGSKIPNLTFNHKSLESKGQMKSNWGVLYIIGKYIFLKAIRCYHHIFKTNLIW